MSGAEVFRSEHWVAAHDAAPGLVRLTRSSVPFADIAELDRSLAGLTAALARLDRGSLGLLLDAREGPLRNDDAFEQALRKHQAALFGAFAAVAVLIKTAVGKLHATRVSKGAPNEPRIFDDERAALAFLARTAPKRRA